ncbi:hypothetical protein E3E38_03500 [Thermococcus sp. 18S1]|uniref:hypothetical protein n=1 Tax=Thermococcus sp. 18S1 TaxID=1638210 RepID=UPI00143BB574|nr:hypothetical protein [Thermococcus sp. 18S1]NJE30115.1 hypothetical protein [Thermococcus sp. 18S1]
MMPMKRLVGLVLVFLVLGLTASSAMAASDVVPKSTRGIPQTVECPCCSGNVSLLTDLRVQELKGPVAYFKALEVFNSKDSARLLAQLNNTTLLPEYRNARVFLIWYDNVTIEVVEIPLTGSNEGELVLIKEPSGESLAVGINTGKSVTIISLENGTVVKRTVRVLKTGDITPAGYKLRIPHDKFMKACKWVASHLCEEGLPGCLASCIFAPGFVGKSVCVILCWAIKDLLKIEQNICERGVEQLCRKLLELGIIVIE